ncbi:unnamed protein product [Rhizophagus irregularis]|nr:unnamed protein product [Rhizophagus irregularis]
MIIKRNIKREIDDENIDINSMVNNRLELPFNRCSKRRNLNLWQKVSNDINQNVANINSDSHNRMDRINNHQEIDPIGIFSGTEFSQRTDFESLILGNFSIIIIISIEFSNPVYLLIL